MTDGLSEQAAPRTSASRYLWLLVIAMLGVAYWYFHPGRVKAGPDATQTTADRGSPEATASEQPGAILVDLKDDVTDAQIARLEADLGIKLTLDSAQAKAAELFVANVDPAREDAILAELAKRPEVEVAEPNATISLSPDELAADAAAVAAPTPQHEGYPDDPQYKFQWHLRQIGMPEAWKLADGNGVIVAVLDTGVGYEDYKQFKLLPDLAGLTFVEPYNFVDNNTHADDDHGHGSHVTGTIAQVTNNGIGVAGIARNVKIMPLKVLSGSGSGSVAGIADAIRYAADHGAKVINMSLGGAFPSTALKKAVKYAHDHGVTVVCAAGNESRNRVGYPAAYPGAVAVSATQFDESITFYSNTGKDIDIAAPGGNTRVDQNGDGMPDGVLQNTLTPGDVSANGYYGYMGTSMASPHVAGVAALVVGEGITNPDEVEQVLKDSARKPHDQTYNKERYGAGLLDAPAAVLKARSTTGGFTFGIGLLMAGAVAFGARRKKLGMLGLVGGVMVGASGLFFLPWVAPGASSLPVVHMLTHGLPSWDMSVLGISGHGNALFFSALIPTVLLGLGYGVTRLRTPLAGLAIGVAANLAFTAVVPMFALHYVPFAMSTVWLLGNALVCLVLARAALRR